MTRVFPNVTAIIASSSGIEYDAANPMPVSAVGASVDDEGTAIDPDSMSHVYGYTTGNLTTDTATDGVDTWVKTFTYTGGVVTAESLWVKQ